MDFIELAQKRFSTRKYDIRAVEKDKIESCLEAARLAPSACNAQPWHFIVVDKPELKERVARHTFSKVVPFNKFALGAPVIVVVLAEKANVKSQLGSAITGRQLHLIDLGIAVEHFCLQAAALGLGSCILGWFNEKGIKKALGLPRAKRIGLIITMGYPAEKAKAKKRKSLDGIRSYN